MLSTDNLINNKYKINKLIGTGTFGNVYSAYNIRKNELVALKICNNKYKYLLENEAKIYKYLHPCVYIPKIKWYGNYESLNYLSLELLGLNLDNIKKKLNTFSFQTILQLGYQMINIIKCIHDKNILHRDIKPENFALDLKHGKKLYLIDFGLSKVYKENNNNNNSSKSIVGTLRYASLYIHNKMMYSKRDDLISLGYLLIYLFKGELPWQNIKASNYEEKVLLIKKHKESLSIKKLCCNTNNVMNLYLNYCYRLDINENPDYNTLIKLFENKYNKLYDNINNIYYDWNKDLDLDLYNY